MWLHLDGEAITEARHCVICQPHGHVIDAACADCGDGPLITGQAHDLGDHPAGPALIWLRQHGWHTIPACYAPFTPTDHRPRARLRPVTASRRCPRRPPRPRPGHCGQVDAPGRR